MHVSTTSSTIQSTLFSLQSCLLAVLAEDADGVLLDAEGLVDPAAEGGDTACDPSDPKTEQAAAAAAAAASGNSTLRDRSFIGQSCRYGI